MPSVLLKQNRTPLTTPCNLEPLRGLLSSLIMSDPIKRVNLNFEQHEMLLKLLTDNLPNDPASAEFELFYTTYLKLKKAPTYQTTSNKSGNSVSKKVQ